MKTLGIIGGMSWESTQTYYTALNRLVRKAKGGLHSAPLVIWSVDFAPLEAQQAQGDWNGIGDELGAIARRLQDAGAEGILLATNTMHKVAEAICGGISVPFLHIAEATATAVTTAGLHKVGLLGTRYTMEQDFYRSKLEAVGLDVVVPAVEARAEINRIIFDELCLGICSETSRRFYLEAIVELRRNGAEGIILGCTEIGLLITPELLPGCPLFDTAEIHAQAAARFILS